MDVGPDPAAGIVRVSDVARVELAAATYDNGATLDGRPSCGLAVRLLPDANALEVGDRVRAKMAELKTRFPEGVDYAIVYDTTPFIRESIRDVVFTLFEAVGLVALVVLVFLQSWRATLIPMVAVPVAILGTFAVMLALGFTLNNISLFGLVLAIGIVVDDAIVVVENVERWLDHGLAPRDAAYKAMGEVTGPVVAIALILCAVFVPCAFVGGIPGQFYRQFAVTITASTVFSAINSLTLSPALAAILLQSKARRRGPQGVRRPGGSGSCSGRSSSAAGCSTAASGCGHARLRLVVGRLLRVSLLVLAVYGGLLWLTVLDVHAGPARVRPAAGPWAGCIVSVQLPDSASLNRTQAVMARVDEISRRTPGVAHTTSAIGMSLPGRGQQLQLRDRLRHPRPVRRPPGPEPAGRRDRRPAPPRVRQDQGRRRQGVRPGPGPRARAWPAGSSSWSRTAAAWACANCRSRPTPWSASSRRTRPPSGSSPSSGRAPRSCTWTWTGPRSSPWGWT